MSEHIHEHGEHCSCGHDHHAQHEHDENGNCLLEDHDTAGGIHVECHLHDEARVISGRLTVTGNYETVKAALTAKLGHIARAVHEMGGIVGHIKASCEVTAVDMFSVTDTEVSVKKAPEQTMKINLAAIIFLMSPEDAEALVTHALTAVRDSIH